MWLDDIPHRSDWGGAVDIAEADRLNRLALEREVAYIARTQGDRAARRARRLLTAAVDDLRRDLVQRRLESPEE